MKLRKLIYLLPVLMVPMISVPILMTSCSDENTKHENNNTQGDSNNSSGSDNNTSGGNNNNNSTNPPSGGGGSDSNTGSGGSNGSGGSTGGNNGTTGNAFYEKYKHLDGKDVKLVYKDGNNNAKVELGTIKLYPDKDFFLIDTKVAFAYYGYETVIRLGEKSDNSITDPTYVEKYQGFKGKNVKVTFNTGEILEFVGTLIDLTDEYVFLRGSGEAYAYSVPWNLITKIEATKTI